jgi:RNA polymerase sigma-70 factor, ECF subfamily
MAEPPGKRSSDVFIALILSEHRGALLRYLQTMGVVPQDLEDVLQEILHGAARAHERFVPEGGSLRAWLIGIATRQVSHYLDRAHRRREQIWAAEQLDPIPDEAPSSEAQMMALDDRKLLNELLAEVPLERRSVLVAHDILEMSMDEVAEAFSLNLHTAWWRHGEGLRDLKAAVERWRARRRHRGLDDSRAILLLLLDQARAPEVLPERGGAGDAAKPSPGSGGPARWNPWPRAGAPGRRGASLVIRVVGGPALGVAVGLLGPMDVASLTDHVTAAPWRQEAEVVFALARVWGAHESASEEPAPAGPVKRVEPPATPVAAAMQKAPAAQKAQAAMQKAPAAQKAPAPARHAPFGRTQGGPSNAEVKLVERAAVALAANQRNEAHSLLEKHAREFPRGRLAARRDELLRQLGAR